MRVPEKSTFTSGLGTPVVADVSDQRHRQVHARKTSELTGAQDVRGEEFFTHVLHRKRRVPLGMEPVRLRARTLSWRVDHLADKTGAHTYIRA